MGEFFLSVGSFALLIGIVWVIVAFARKTPKKKPMLLFVAGFVFMIVGGALADPVDEPEVAEEAAPVEDVEDAATEPAEAEEEPVEEVVDEGLTPVQQVEQIIFDKLGEENNMGKERIISVEDISDEADGSYLVIVMNGSENFSSELTRRTLQMDAAEVLEPIAAMETTKKVVLQWFLPLVDPYGNENDTQVMIINIEEDALAQINWENFDSRNFEAVSDNYFEHAAIKD